MPRYAAGTQQPHATPHRACTGDATSPRKRQILVVPLHVLPDGVVADRTIWAVDQSKTFVVLGQEVQLEVDRSVFFASDSLGIRAVIRVGFGFPHEQAVAKITWGEGS